MDECFLTGADGGRVESSNGICCKASIGVINKGVYCSGGCRSVRVGEKHTRRVLIHGPSDEVIDATPVWRRPASALACSLEN